MTKWKVSRNPMCGYQVYRTIDPNEVDHCGNRQFDMNCYDNRADAQKRADELNRLSGEDQ